MKKILVIEDEPTVRSNLLELLSAEGFETSAAADGLAGLALALSIHPDLILSDVMIPELDGYGVLSAVRQDPKTASTPFIFLTARTDRSDLRQGMNLGADDYLTKPFTRADLMSAIQTRLKKQDAVVERYTAELKQAEQKLDQLAHYDSVTGLPNRLLLRSRLQQRLNQDAGGKQTAGLLYIGLDRFDRIIDSLGSVFGDVLIKFVADRLVKCAGSDVNIVARMEKAEFAVVMIDVETQEQIVQMAESIRQAISHPFHLESKQVFLTASIGMTMDLTGQIDVEELVRDAKTAMDHVRQTGSDQSCFYDDATFRSTADELALEADLRYALERDQLEVHYQPQVDLKTGRILGSEALLRWRHPERGLIPPAEFIPLAEDNGLIVPIGEWVVKTACEQTKRWQQLGQPDLRVAVNLSPRQFNQPDLAEKLTGILEETEFEPDCLELEITEGTLMRNVESASAIIQKLKSAGVQISIDDFGTGYSSLSYLKSFPFDSLKIDRSFIRNLTEDPKTPAITASIIQMAHALQLQVVAEGVESTGELSFLCLHHCDSLQGYLFSRPVIAHEFEKLLVSGKRLDTGMEWSVSKENPYV